VQLSAVVSIQWRCSNKLANVCAALGVGDVGEAFI
jgi:hypothetical protein